MQQSGMETLHTLTHIQAHTEGAKGSAQAGTSTHSQSPSHTVTAPTENPTQNTPNNCLYIIVMYLFFHQFFPLWIDKGICEGG